MVRKSVSKERKGDTRLLYKKSNNTICTQSRTCSGASQYYTRSAILQIKKNLSEATEQYIDGDKIKRDFSIETDICILRRYYKSKRLKMSNQGGSAKSKYSTVIDTELDEMEEFKPDSSACGDSRHTVTNNITPKADLATLMLENLKGLLNNWIHKHLLDSKNNKDKINTVLDSMLHRIDLNVAGETNSQSTYILNRDQKSCQVKNKKLETSSVMCQYCKHKSRPLIINTSSTAVYKGFSSHSVPFSIKKIRLVSTLSIPRNIHRIRKINSLRIQKIGRKKIALTIDRSSKLLKSSSFDLLAISTKSLTKRCATYDLRHPYRKASTAYYPKPIHKNTNNSKIESQIINGDNLEDMPSLFKSIYAGDPANVTSTEKIIIKSANDTFTITENFLRNKIQKIPEENSRCTMVDNRVSYRINSISQKDQSEPLVNMNFKNKSFEAPKASLNKFKENYSTSIKINKKSNRNRSNKYDKRPHIRGNQNKNFSIQYNKMNSKQTEDKQLLKSFQNVLKYFSDYGNNKNIKFDININFFPLQDGIDKCTNVSSKILSNNVKLTPTVTSLQHIINIPEGFEENLKENNESLEDVPEITIIPSLDNVNQSKCTFNNESSMSIITSRDTAENKKTLGLSDLELVKEISELKSVIKDLAIAAEKFVAERSKEDENFLVKTENTKNRSIYNNSSKAVQFSSHFQALVQCGIKLSKEPKKDANDYYNRLMKKSNSYNVIDSESILKVTDMTVINETNNQKNKEEGLSCSLPKSRSLFELTNGKKSKIATFYCEKCAPKPDYIYDCKVSTYNTPCCTLNDVSEESKCLNNPSKCEKNSSPCLCTDSSTLAKKDSEKCSKCKDSIIDQLPDKDSNVCRNKAGLGFGEGFLYCLLLWIPVIIILCLFYSYVLHDIIRPGPALTKLREGDGNNLRCKNNDTLELKLSDLGF
ncbi:hypothetical protein K1T71_013931 [Dendrolimus kikuchii]|uniref:Uncharacterized protein n=1 Tax=Dendrolimus kikuchii TaxID=765133 RepID=A0ACC1CGC7_9NEOP|nr:hypothetical protein K1T71_013931 [Dendrolimus kikuchii]